MEPLDRIPDGIEPIVGYRGWIYALHGSRTKLHPISFGRSYGLSPWDGAESGWVLASCAVDPVDLEHVPGWSCTCGFYATKILAPFPKAILAMDPACEDGVESGWIFGRVELCPSATRFPSSRCRPLPILRGPRKGGHLPLGSE